MLAIPILGIDEEKCNLCKNCVDICPNCYSFNEEDQKIIFNDTLCILCGRCICRCQMDVINHEDMGEALTFDGVKDQYMSDEGLGIQLIESHSLFKITA